MPNGMLGNPNIPGEAGRYMYGHGYALLFLSCVYGEEEEGERRRKLEDMLTRAAKFTRDAQTQRESTRYRDKNGKRSSSAAGATSRPRKATTSTKAP